MQVTDTLRFFTGDHPALQYEQGTKQGGHYKCGACGCEEGLFSDQAHALLHPWRTLQQLQSLATGGSFGKQAGALHPLQYLKVGELRRELQSRGVRFAQGTKKDELQHQLDDILRGVIRVPALLLTNPTECLSTLGLNRYEVLASEPLHDLKGHIINLITELPSILPEGETAIKCTHLISCCLAKDKKSAADLRRAVIQIYLLLKDTDVHPRILLFLQTIIKVGEILYSLDSARSPRQLLQLYNCCWLHMELCRDLMAKPQKLSECRMFGVYVHALTVHSPTQYELASLRSLNSENQERLFGQARVIAESCTNHHPDNVIPQVMLRLQAKQERHMAMASVEKGDSQVSSVAKDLPKLQRTTINRSFLRHKGDSWQLHLRRISPFLISGEGVWWRYVSGGFQFLDGDADRETQDGNDFTLLHFRKHSVVDVDERRGKCWKRIIDERLVIPATDVKVFDDGELCTGRIEYRDGTAKFVPFAVVGSSAGGGGMGSSVGGGSCGGSDAAFVGSSAGGGGMGSSVGGGSDAAFVGSSAGGGGMGSSVGGGSDAAFVGSSAGGGGMGSSVGGGSDAVFVCSSAGGGGMGSSVGGGSDAAFVGSSAGGGGMGSSVGGGSDAAFVGSSAGGGGMGSSVGGGSDAAFVGSSAGGGGMGSSVGGGSDAAFVGSSAGGGGMGSSVGGGSDAAFVGSSAGGGGMGSSVGGGSCGGSCGGSDAAFVGSSTGGGGMGSSVGGGSDAAAVEDTNRAHLNLALDLSPQQQGLTTSVASYIHQLMQPNSPNTLQEFDTLRASLKRTKGTKEMKSRYRMLTATIGTEVLAKQSLLQKDIQDKEMKHLEEHGTLPNKNSNSCYNELLKKKKLATSILRNLDINF